ncbi:extracellular solute-binding protein [Anaerocolumna sp. MB42-C2]|uniref:extracellular solute-binding protein n=1 Tax=Anaerocolumna sp. MB42-C2 TaxID=3070997 RepID=UPI0027E1D0C8|nr:extracellular solute-binding protein [Anaerocolumna sp. MB42-C2]WMJ87173.1 extracellular solute-binding protein [Anaerocolumna sp. MB42-C2]
MKKITQIIALFLVVTMMLTGCSSETATKETNMDNNEAVTKSADHETDEKEPARTAEPVELTLWHQAEDGVVKVLSEEFAKLEPGIKVNIVRKENLSDALKLAAGDAGASPDLVWYANDSIGMFAEMGVFEPIDDYVDTNEFNRFLPLTKDAGEYKGKHYQIPAYYETVMFMYNKALLSKAPETTDELLEMMKEKTKNGNYGFVEQHSTAYYVSAWMHAFGGYIINENAEPGLDSQQMIDAINYHKQFAKLMPVDGEYNTITTLFLEGKAAAIASGPWFVSAVKDAGIDLGVAPLPTVSENGKALQPYSGVQGISLISTSKNKDAAKTVLNFLCKKDLSEALAIANGAAPAHSEAYDNTEIQNNEIIMTLKACAENAIPMPNIPQMNVMWTCTENALAAINKSDADTVETLKAAQQEALSQIKAME